MTHEDRPLIVSVQKAGGEGKMVPALLAALGIDEALDPLILGAPRTPAMARRRRPSRAAGSRKMFAAAKMLGAR